MSNADSTVAGVVQDEYGGPDTLRFGTIEKPTPGKKEVLVEVKAAGIDRGVWHLMTGMPYVVRLGFGLTKPRNRTPGFDVAGVVAAVGPGADDFQVGDEVMGIGVSTFAEFAVAKQKKLVHKPANISWEEAGAATISGITAYEALQKGGLALGSKVLVVGASGGVGSFAVQIAAAAGASVVGVASAAKADFVRSLGAEQCLDYRVGPLKDIARDAAPFDLVLDAGSLTSLSDLRSLLTKDGSLLSVGGEGGGAIGGGFFARSLGSALLSPFVSQKIPVFLSTESREFIEPVRDLLADGSVKTALSQAYPLSDAAQAMSDLESGKLRGKAVLTI